NFSGRTTQFLRSSLPRPRPRKTPMPTLTNARLHDRLIDVRLEGGRIAAIGPAGSPGTGDAIDLEGRWLLPGLWDHHVHLTQHALTLRRVDLTSVASAAEAASVMAAALAASPPEPGLPLVGGGFRDGLWPDVPSVDLL